MITDITHLRDAFVKQGTKFAGRPPPTPLAKAINPYSPFTGVIEDTYSDQWKLQRHTVLQVLRNLGYGRSVTESSIVEEAEILIELFKSKGTQAFHVDEHITKAVANIICHLLFGDRYDYEDEEFKVLYESIDSLFKSSEQIILYDSMPGANLLPFFRKNKKILLDSAEKLNHIIDKKIKRNTSDEDKGEPTNFIQGYQQEREKNPAIENRIHQMLLDFIEAGMETTATTLGWAVYYMIAYPEVQKKCQEELDRVIGRSRRPRLSDREQCVYVSATLLEILRIGTTAPIALPHESLEEARIGDYTIPKGIQVWASIWRIMRDPEVWPDPLVLKPERFLDDDGKLKNYESFIPFGLGRRSCLGEQLAKQELFLFFSFLIHGLTFSCPEGESVPEPIGLIALTHRAPEFKVCVTSRD